MNPKFAANLESVLQSARKGLMSFVAYAALIVAFLQLQNARAEHRIALLIGNAEYTSQTALASPENDLRVIDATLDKQGFRTLQAVNLTYEGIRAAVRRFVEEAPINGTGLIYFSGDVVCGKAFDNRETPVILGTGKEGKGLPVIELMDWLFLHSATAQNVIVLDDRIARPVQVGNSAPYGISTKDLPANTWLGFAKERDTTSDSRNKSVFVNSLLTSDEIRLARLLKRACGWKATTCRKPLFSEPASRAIAPPVRFPGHANPGDEWVTDDGAVYCYCPPNASSSGFWIAKYEATLSKWPIPGLYAGIGNHRNVPTTQQRTKDVIARLASMTSEGRKAGRLPSDWEYALPSPEQWEYAARAGSAGDRYFEESELVLHANFADKSLFDTGEEDYVYADRRLNDGTAKLASVGNYLPNAWGVHDVYGNVWELTSAGTLCGGSWVSVAEYCRATIRKPPLEFPSDYVGLRVIIRPVEAGGREQTAIIDRRG